MYCFFELSETVVIDETGNNCSFAEEEKASVTRSVGQQMYNPLTLKHEDRQADRKQWNLVTDIVV